MAVQQKSLAFVGASLLLLVLAGSLAVAEPEEAGRALLEGYGCVGCHRIGGAGGDLGPALDGVLTRRTASWVEEKIRNPRTSNRASIMPPFVMSESEIQALLGYLNALNGEGGRE